MSGIIRIIADRSRDSTGAMQFANLLPYAEFQSTGNRRPLRRSVLSKYDVLAICGQSLKKYTRLQLAMIREFVEAGGGLVLAASAPIAGSPRWTNRQTCSTWRATTVRHKRIVRAAWSWSGTSRRSTAPTR